MVETSSTTLSAVIVIDWFVPAVTADPGPALNPAEVALPGVPVIEIVPLSVVTDAFPSRWTPSLLVPLALLPTPISVIDPVPSTETAPCSWPAALWMSTPSFFPPVAVPAVPSRTMFPFVVWRSW